MLIDFRDRKGEREKEGGTTTWERNIDQLPPICTATGDGTHNLGTIPDWELNPQPFDKPDDAPTYWTTWPGLNSLFKINILYFK